MEQGKATRGRKDDPTDEEDESDIISVDDEVASDAADDEKWENVNRIKIVPPTEERPQGSIGAIVVKKMLIQFDETKGKEKKQLLLKRKFPKLMGQEEETEIEDRDGEKEEEKGPAKSLGTKHLEESNRKTRMLIHDLSGPIQRLYSRKRRRQQQENVLSSFSTEDIKKLPQLLCETFCVGP